MKLDSARQDSNWCTGWLNICCMIVYKYGYNIEANSRYGKQDHIWRNCGCGVRDTNTINNKTIKCNRTTHRKTPQNPVFRHWAVRWLVRTEESETATPEHRNRVKISTMSACWNNQRASVCFAAAHWWLCLPLPRLVRVCPLWKLWKDSPQNITRDVCWSKEERRKL